MVSAGWVSGQAGRRWCTVWQPSQGAVRGTVLFVPPLGDEMNHTRPVLSAAARTLAAAGWRVQCTDPYGTGDSEGDFAEASLTVWAEDFAADAVTAARQGPWVLWCARQGALLLPALAATLAQRGAPRPVALAFWNPLWQGSSVVTQWLRVAALAIASAASVTASSGSGGSGVAALRQRLANGETVPCAGYALSPGLASALEAVQVAPMPEWPQSMPWLAGVPVQEWDAAAAGARRFWLPHEDTTDTQLVAPLVNWLAGLMGSAGDMGSAGTTRLVAPTNAAGSATLAAFDVSPSLLEVPPGAATRCGVLFVVGGPQYRVGAHRQFVRWSRQFNAAGHATCRFDRAGTGDAPGERAALLDCGAELRGALEQAARASGVRRWVVFGLCDGASLGLLHLAGHSSVAGAVAGVVAVNPWLPATPVEQARALVSEYYGRQLFSSAFWRRLLRGEVKVLAALQEWWQHRRLARSHALESGTRAEDVAVRQATAAASVEAHLSAALLARATAVDVPVLWALSGNDRTAAEFRAAVAGDVRWQAVLAKPASKRLDLEDADHTLSAVGDHDRLAAAVVEWLTRVA